jgi:hypothetical protein
LKMSTLNTKILGSRATSDTSLVVYVDILHLLQKIDISIFYYSSLRAPLTSTRAYFLKPRGSPLSNDILEAMGLGVQHRESWGCRYHPRPRCSQSYSTGRLPVLVQCNTVGYLLPVVYRLSGHPQTPDETPKALAPAFYTLCYA